MTRDIRLAIRMLGRNRRFAVLAVSVLGLGIGINNMLVTILNAHTIRGLPIDRAERVLSISTVNEQNRPGGVSYPDFQDLQVAGRSFSALAAFVNAPITVGDDGRAPERLNGAYLTPDAFGIVGVRPARGRAFTADEDRAGAVPVVLLGNRLWVGRYGRDPQIVGRSILVNGAPAAVIGIISDRSGLPSAADVWLPLSQMPELGRERREMRTLSVFGRMRDDATLETARAEIEALSDRLARDYPSTNKDVRARVVPINEQFLGRLSDPAWRAFIAVGFLVFAISCANVGNLFLNRSIERTREIAIRTALGASRGRVVRQLLIEASVLASAGGLVGLGVALAGVRLFRGLIPDNVLPYWFDYSVDARVLGMLVGVSIASVLVFGLIPAISGSKADVNEALQEARDIGRRRSRRWTAVFLTAEFALAVVMLANLALSLRLSTSRVPSDDAIDTTEVLTAALTLSGERYRTGEQRAEFFGRLEQSLSAAPGISVAAIASVLPGAAGIEREVEIAGVTRTVGDSPLTAVTVLIGPGYFRTFGLAPLRGREFGEQDGNPGQRHAIVNERAAGMYFGNQDPIGQRIAASQAGASRSSAEWLTVIGVAPDIRQQGRPRAPGAWQVEPVVYLPYRPAPPVTAALVLRGTADAGDLATVVRDRLMAIDPTIPLYRVRTMAGVIDDAGWNSRVSSTLFNVLTFIAVALSTLGLYGVTAHSVNQRTRELGLRIALGARPHHLGVLILGRMLAQVTVGFVAGIACTLVWDWLYSSGRPGIEMVDARSLATIAAVLLLLAMVAGLVPVWRTTRLDPSAAMRQE